jgi:hypothetical protein
MVAHSLAVRAGAMKYLDLMFAVMAAFLFLIVMFALVMNWMGVMS